MTHTDVQRMRQLDPGEEGACYMKPELKMGSKHVVDDTSWALVCDNEKSEPSSVRTGLSKTTTVTYHRCAAQAPFLGTAKRPIESPTPPPTNDNNQLPGRPGARKRLSLVPLHSAYHLLMSTIRYRLDWRRWRSIDPIDARVDQVRTTLAVISTSL